MNQVYIYKPPLMHHERGLFMVIDYFYGNRLSEIRIIRLFPRPILFNGMLIHILFGKEYRFHFIFGEHL